MSEYVCKDGIADMENQSHKGLIRPLLVGILIGFLTPLIIALAISRVQPILPGATAVKLVAGCQATLMDTRIQPVFTISLDCPRVDSIRLWPLPIIQPFYEDGYEGKPEEEMLGTGRRIADGIRR